MNRKRRNFEEIFEDRRRPPPFESSASTLSSNENHVSSRSALPSASIAVSSRPSLLGSTRKSKGLAELLNRDIQVPENNFNRCPTHNDPLSGHFLPHGSTRSSSQPPDPVINVQVPISSDPTPPALHNSCTSTSHPTAVPSTRIPSGVGRQSDVSLAIMASTLLNREVQSETSNLLDEMDLDGLASLAEEAVNKAAADLRDDPFNDPRILHRAHIDALKRIRSLRKDTETRWATLCALSPNSDACAIQHILSQTEHAISATKLDLEKHAQKNAHLKAEIDGMKDVILKVEEKLKTWRVHYPDKSPLRINNSGATFNPALAKNTPTLIAYVMALVGRVMEGFSRRSASFLLKGLRLFGYSLSLLQDGGPNHQQKKALHDIPEDIRALENNLRLDIKTTIYAVCPRCGFTYLPSFSTLSTVPSYPRNCTNRLTCLADLCNEPLLGDDNIPIKTYEYYSFLDWFGQFLATPGIAQYSDAFCAQVTEESPPSDKNQTADGRFFYELRDADGKLFIRERGKEGRWFFKLHADFFNIEGNRIGGKHNSTGVISMTCLNLPLEFREDPAYIYIAGILQGPEEPDAKEVEHNHYVRPLVDELLVAYNRGVQCAITDGQETSYEITHRMVLAFLSMDFKASRPFAGLLDVQSHNYCFTCKTWHRAYLGSVNFEDWEPANDGYLREGAEKWRAAQHKEDRKLAEQLYGVRFTEFWRLPYWQPSKQVVVDAMHTMYLILQKSFFRDALRLDNPSNAKDPKNKTTAPESSVAHNYKFTPPPPLSLLGSSHLPVGEEPTNPDDHEDEFLVTSVLQWDHLQDAAQSLRLQRFLPLKDIIHSDPRLMQQLTSVHHLLSSTRPSTVSAQAQFQSKLKSRKWAILLYVCNDLMIFPTQKASTLCSKALITKSDITKDDMVESLLEWRLNGIQEVHAFLWPHFTPTDFAPPKAPWAQPVLLPMYDTNAAHRMLSVAERETVMRELICTFNYKSAVGIGHIHQHLWAPMENNEIGREKLAKSLKQEPRNSLLYVCADLNVMPLILPLRSVTKKDLVHQLIHWRLTQPLQAVSWTAVDSPGLLKRVHQAIRETVIPGWINRPSADIGLPKAGTPTADNWRTLFSIFLPLALLSLWQKDSPIAASDAHEMLSVLETSMHLTCAANSMAKYHSTLQDRQNFRTYLRHHLIGLKINFPGFILSSHHLAFHIFDCMDLFGSVHNSWCFPGERLIGKLRRIPVNHKIGEFEGTLLHSFAKGSAFRRWILRTDCPPLLKYFRHVLDKAYGFTHSKLEEIENHLSTSFEATDEIADVAQDSSVADEYRQFRTSTPRELSLLLRSSSRISAIQCYNRVPTLQGNYFGTSTTPGIGSSFVCFYPGGDKRVEWIPGQIQYIFREDGRIRFCIKRSLPRHDIGDADPFHAFWEQGFQAKLLSSAFSNELEIVEYDWVVGHTARWKLHPFDLVVCLNLQVT